MKQRMLSTLLILVPSFKEGRCAHEPQLDSVSYFVNDSSNWMTGMQTIHVVDFKWRQHRSLDEV